VRTAVPAPSPSRAPAACPASSYVNVDGDCVRRPTKAAGIPSGATARCADGTYSSGKNRRGTCSGHGGVAQWL
jgi:hypothetical protein